MQPVSRIDALPGEEVSRLGASPTRRVIGVVMICALGALLIWLAVSQPAEIFWRLLLIVLGGLGIWCGIALWRATAGSIVLKPEGLFTETDAPLVLMDEIDTVERGAFAFKPSNGFSVKLKEPAPFAWAPGLYWRFGRRIGVGGVTSPGEAKAVAELLQVLHGRRTEG
ncbi:hypothetical protein [Palleronia sp. LCG004]|uniref:hypothetical protein n=1 Tax=Palleronia sp. LCG004 TaxID=3079304 RepID=UPI002941BF0B|nr:hypothetical protein [Palleronia sp. LCG004]WOI57052.1 hypothetical protein RVY76_04490 [Palleronia sp. LCG004]